MLNKVTLIGRLGQDPELKQLQNGSVANMSIATTEKWKDRDGKTQERTEWHKVNVWGKLAEICAQNLTKGRTVYAEGRIQTRSYDDKNGGKKYVTEIVAEKVLFLDNPPAQSKPEQSNQGDDWPEESPF